MTPTQPMTPSAPAAPTQKLTPQLNDIQIRQNIDALRRAGMPTDKIQEYVNNYQKDASGNYVLKGTAAPATPKPTGPSAVQKIGSAIADTANQGIETMRSNIRQLQAGPQMDPNAVKESYKQGGIVPAAGEAAGQVLGAGVEGVRELGRTVGGAFQAVTAPLTTFSNAAGEGIGQKIGEATPLPAANAIEKTAVQHPEIGKAASAGMDLANLAMPEVASKIAPGADTALSETKAALGAGAERVKTALTPKISTPEEVAANTQQIKAEVEARQKQAAQEAVQKSAERWKDAPTPVKARQILAENAKDKLDTHKFLAEIGVNLSELPRNGKLLATEETGSELRNYGGKLSSEILRPALEAASPHVPLTPIADAVGMAMTYLEHDKSITAGDIERISKIISENGDALERKYASTDGSLSLLQAHDEKITHAMNSGYRPLSMADNNSAIANRYLAKAFQTIVETHAPSQIDVAGLNEYFSKYYKAADYLDTLNNKKAPVRTISELANRGMKVGGAVVGHALGGGVLPGVGGYIMGGILEHAIEDIIASKNGDFLLNLQHTNPEAFAKAQEYVQKMADLRNIPPKLIEQGSRPGPINQGRPIPAISPNAKGTEYIGKENVVGKYVPPNKAPTGKAKMPPFGEYDENYKAPKDLPVIKFGNKPKK